MFSKITGKRCLTPGCPSNNGAVLDANELLCNDCGHELTPIKVVDRRAVLAVVVVALAIVAAGSAVAIHRFRAALAIVNTPIHNGTGNPQPSPVPAGDQQKPVLIFSYAIDLDGRTGTERVSENFRFRSGDRLRIIAHPGFQASMYLFDTQPGSKSIARLSRGEDIQVPKDADVQFPRGDGKWLKLDQSTGSEEVFLIAATKPIEEFETPSDQLSRSDFEKALARIERDWKPLSSQRSEDKGTVKLQATGAGDATAIVARLSLAHE